MIYSVMVEESKCPHRLLCLSTWSPAIAGVLGGCRKLETGTLLAELGYWGWYLGVGA